MSRRVGKEVQILTEFDRVISDNNYTLMTGKYYKRTRKKIVEINNSLRFFKIDFVHYGSFFIFDI